jgi:hypothetical protein
MSCFSIWIKHMASTGGGKYPNCGKDVLRYRRDMVQISGKKYLIVREMFPQLHIGEVWPSWRRNEAQL